MVQDGEVSSSATFNHRVQHLEHDLANKGFFQIGQYQITRDGGLFKNRSAFLGCATPMSSSPSVPSNSTSSARGMDCVVSWGPSSTSFE